MKRSKIALVRDNTKNHCPREWQAPSDDDLAQKCGLVVAGGFLQRPAQARQMRDCGERNKAAIDLMRALLGLAIDADLQGHVAKAEGHLSHTIPPSRGIQVLPGDLLDAVTNPTHPDDKRLFALVELIRRAGLDGSLRGDMANADQLEICSALFMSMKLAAARHSAEDRRGGATHCDWYQVKRQGAGYARLWLLGKARPSFENQIAEAQRNLGQASVCLHETIRPAALCSLQRAWEDWPEDMPPDSRMADHSHPETLKILLEVPSPLPRAQTHQIVGCVRAAEPLSENTR